MPRVYTKKAAKDYPREGIRRGQTYYTWKRRHGPVQRSATYPRRSQLTGSSFLSTVWDVYDVEVRRARSGDDLRAAAESLREAGQEAQSSLDNMPEGLQQGDTGQQLEQRVSDCDAGADQLDELADELDEHIEKIEAWADWLAARPDGQEDCDDTQEMPEGVDEAEWRTWVEAKPEEPEHESEDDAISAVLEKVEEPDFQ